MFFKTITNIIINIANIDNYIFSIFYNNFSNVMKLCQNSLNKIKII